MAWSAAARRGNREVVSDDEDGLVRGGTDMGELDWSSSLVDHKTTHSWWFTGKVGRLDAAVLRLFACPSWQITLHRFGAKPSELGVPPSA